MFALVMLSLLGIGLTGVGVRAALCARAGRRAGGAEGRTATGTPDRPRIWMEVSGRSADLTYDEGDHRLVLPLELSGVIWWSWIGTDPVDRWTEPQGEPISAEKRRQIRKRVTRWSFWHGQSIFLGPPDSEG